MLSGPKDVSKNVNTKQNTANSPTTSQHGQHRNDDLQASPQSHSSELWGASESSEGGNERDKTRSLAHSDDTGDAGGLRDITASPTPPKNRITEYENALANSPRKLSDGPLFEVIRSNRRPDDKTSPIAKLPNGE